MTTPSPRGKCRIDDYCDIVIPEGETVLEFSIIRDDKYKCRKS